MLQKVDKKSRTPLYLQIIDQIMGAIKNKSVAKGEKIVNEYELCKIFDVSRETVRQALRALEEDGYIYRKRGGGTFIGSQKLDTGLMQKAVFSYDEFKEKGINFNTVILKKEIIEPPSDVYTILKCDANNNKVNYVERIRLIEEEPFYYTIFYISNYYCRDLIYQELERKSSAHIIEDYYGLKIKKIERYLEPVNQKYHKKIAKTLNMDEDECFHYMQTIIYIANNIPVGYYRDYFPGKKSRFTLIQEL